MFTNGSHLSGSASSGKIASTGHSGSQAPQSMHSSGSITSIRPNSWMQSTGQTSTQDLSLMSIQGSAMMYVISRNPSGAARRGQGEPSAVRAAAGQAVAAPNPHPILASDRLSFGGPLVARQLGNELRSPLDERRLHDHLIETGRVARAQPGGVRVVRVAEDRDVGPVVRHVERVDSRDVADDEIGRLGRVLRDELMLAQ